jgi:hypothetical protein
MESSALARKARNIGERAWDAVRTLEELERTLPPDLLARLGELHALLAKLRADLADPELQVRTRKVPPWKLTTTGVGGVPQAGVRRSAAGLRAAAALEAPA